MSSAEISKLAAEARTANDDIITIGDRLKVRTTRGWVEATVTNVIHKWRARKYPYIIQTTDDAGNDYSGKKTNNTYSRNPNYEFISRGGGSAKTVQDSNKRRQDRQDQRDDKVALGQKALRKWDLKPGDVIRYQYSNGTMQEIVTGTNFKTGKVGIDRFKGDARGKAKYIKDIREDNETRELMDYLMGIRVRRRSDRSTRWLPADGILAVVSRAS
jgi:hypothetical protein